MDEADGAALEFHTALAELGRVPGEAETAVRLLVADSLICAVAMASGEPTRIAIGTVAPTGGAQEPEVVGMTGRLSAAAAALVNADAMNLLDALSIPRPAVLIGHGSGAKLKTSASIARSSKPSPKHNRRVQ